MQRREFIVGLGAITGSIQTDAQELLTQAAGRRPARGPSPDDEFEGAELGFAGIDQVLEKTA
jgi:hypothetical protein